jgi:PAS domain S-box-containing protein
MKREISYEEIEKDLAELNKALKTVKKKAPVEKALNNIIENVKFQATELRKREEELEFLRQAVSSASDMFYTFDSNAVTTYINPTFTKITGFTEKDMIGKPIEDWPALPPDVRPITAQRVRERVKRGEPVTNVETELIKKSGKRFPVRYSASEIKDINRKVIGEVVVATDITELKKREREQANAISAFSKILGEAAKGDLSARLDTKGWNEELETIGIAINTLVESLEFEKKQKS